MHLLSVLGNLITKTKGGQLALMCLQRYIARRYLYVKPFKWPKIGLFWQYESCPHENEDIYQMISG
jgi:hypothetical protein